jgi:hypothetical protein
MMWSQPGGDIQTPAESTASFATAGSFRVFPVTNAVQQWAKGAPNDGFLLKSLEEESKQVISFASHEDAYRLRQPRLTIRYWQPEVGIQVHPWDLEGLPRPGGGTWSESGARSEVLTKIDNAGLGWIRMDVGWASYEPIRNAAPPNWYLEEIGSVMNLAKSKGLKVLVTLWYTPRWAVAGSCADGGDEGRTEDLCRNNPPDNPSEFGDFAGALAARFKGQIDAYEIWNEPDLQGFWAPTGPKTSRNYFAGTRTHAELLEAAYGRIKSRDPTAVVLNGGPSVNDSTWISELYQRSGSEGNGVKDDFDALATHAYVHESDNPPRCIAPTQEERKYTIEGVEKIRGIMTSPAVNDDATPIWFTEFGWFTAPNPPSEANDESLSNTSIPVTPSEQADFAVRSIRLLSRYEYVKNVFWYNSHDHSSSGTRKTFGLLNRNLTAKPSYGEVNSLLGGRPTSTWSNATCDF